MSAKVVLSFRINKSIYSKWIDLFIRNGMFIFVSEYK